MKIGVLTFHRAINYGAVLQCWALQFYLQSKGHQVEIIDYQNKKMLRCYNVFSIERVKDRNLKKMICNIWDEMKYFSKRYARKKAFRLFVKDNFVCSAPGDMEKYDLIIIGSDQVWNTKLTFGFDDYYWGNFSKKKGCRVISYAASVETLWNVRDFPFVKRYLMGFDGVSVREQSIISPLSKILDRSVNECVDPTLLLNRKDWLQLADDTFSDSEPYLLLYQVRNTQATFSLAQKMASEKKLKLICLSAKVDEVNSPCVQNCSPTSFLSLFQNASFVLCTSFHGTVFSIMFHKPFYSIKLGDGRDSRADNLLVKLNLRNRMIESCPQLEEEINYDEVDNKIIELSAQSKEFLERYVE